MLWAAHYDNPDIVKLLLLEKGVDLDARYRRGQTLLHWAAEEGHTDIAEMLLNKGA